MRKLIITCTLILFSSFTFAESVARFQYNFTLESMMSGEYVAEMNCEVRQVLQWGNAVNVFKCTNLIDDNVFLMKGINGVIGYSYQKNVAYTKYYLGGANGLVSTLLKKLGFEEKILGAGMAEFYFYESSPRLGSTETIINLDNDDALILNMSDVYYLN